MKKILLKSTLLSALILIMSSCGFFQLETAVDPNNPSLGSVANNATRNQIQSLVTGLESRHRDYVFTITAAFGAFGREVWYLNASDPRWQTDWLGQGGRKPDSQFFGFGATGGAAYATPYQCIKQGNVLLEALKNTSSVTEQEKSAITGLVKTIQGYQYMIAAMGQYQNGIRMDVSNELEPGPFVTYTEALTQIQRILNIR